MSGHVRLESAVTLAWNTHQAHQTSNRRGGGFLQPVNDQRLKQCSEARIGFGPRHGCRHHAVLRAFHPRHSRAVGRTNSGFTALFEALVIDWLKEASTSAVARLMGLSWNAIDGIMQRAVKRGLARRKKTCAQHLGVDETAFRKRHDYVSIVSDQDNGTVLYVGKDRKKADLKQWFEALPRSCLEAIESVSMDMWPAFINATLEMVPGAESKIAFDKFHVAKISLARRSTRCAERSTGN